MYDIRADVEKNCLILRLEGHFDEKDAINAVEKTKRESDKLQKDFSIINDISKFKPMKMEVAERIKEAQKYVFKKGVTKVIRVVGELFGKLQFERVQEEANVGYEVIEVETFEDALKLIE